MPPKPDTVDSVRATRLSRHQPRPVALFAIIPLPPQTTRPGTRAATARDGPSGHGVSRRSARTRAHHTGPEVGPEAATVQHALRQGARDSRGPIDVGQFMNERGR